MSDEPSGNNQLWWPPGQPDHGEPADLNELGRMRSPSPIAPLRFRFSRRPYVLAGVAVVALLGGAGAAFAATNSATPAATPSAVTATPVPPAGAGQPGARPGFRHFGGWFGFGGGMGGALHGQFTVAKPGGGYETIDVQSGQVTAVSNSSITLKSADGFTKSYAVAGSTLVDAQRDGIGSVKAGNQASVVATVSGSNVTAIKIIDMTLLRQSHQMFGFGPGTSGAPGQPG